MVEKSATVYIGAQAIGGAVNLSDEDINFMRDFFLNKYGQK
jgi:L-fuculose-phosphate aldolase